MRINSPSLTPPWVIKVCFILMIFLPLSPPPQIVNKITQKMVQILVQKWSKKSLKKVQLSKGRMVQSIFFFLRKAHYPNSSSFVLICFFVCFSCCFVCLLVMLHFSAFFAFSFIHQFTAMVLITTRCYGARGDHIWPWFGKTYTPPFYKASSPPFSPQKQFWWTPSAG